VIRWPQDALIFSVRVRGCGVYAAGYVEGDTSSQEILGARQTSQGLELVALRGVRNVGSFVELRANRGLRCDGVAAVLDVFIPQGSLQPMTTSSLGSAERVVVVERLPADVHLADFSRQLLRQSGGRPPIGLALRVARDVAHIYATAPSLQLFDDDRGATSGLRLTRRADNILLGWDGTVNVQPRVALVEPNAVSGHMDDDEAVVACGRHLLRLLASEIPDVDARELYPHEVASLVANAVDALRGEVPAPVGRLVRQAVGAEPMPKGAPPLSLAALIARLDELLVEEPFTRADLAGTLAQLFAEERAQDLAFREDLAACDLDALTLPEVKAVDVDGDVFAAILGDTDDPLAR
jgi:hypothetical protein